MKRIRSITALLMAVLLLIGSWGATGVSAAEPVAAVAETQALTYYGRTILGQMKNSAALQYAYDKLVAGVEAGYDEIDISHRTYEISRDEASAVVDLVRADRPDFFWLAEVGVGVRNDVCVAFYPTYSKVGLQYVPAIQQRVEALTAGLEGKSDYEKSMLLHDRLCDAVTYLSGSNDQTVIGSLLDGAAVCAGYARGYQILMQAVGIPCFFVTGVSEGIGHAWNLVQLDGEWYYTDVTWDDQMDDENGNIYYTYLNVTYDQISIDHTATEYADYLPRSTATAANFFVKNGLVLHHDEEPNIAQLARGMLASYPPQFLYTGEDTTEGVYLLFDIMNDLVLELMGSYTPYEYAYVGCLGPGLLVKDFVIDHPHTFESTYLPATCTVDGVESRRCTQCGYTEKTVLEATGHEFDWVAEEAHHVGVCRHCGLTTEPGEHLYNNDGVTCDVCGYQKGCKHQYLYPCGRFCTLCGLERLIDVAHTFDSDRDPDCNVCGEVRQLPVLRGDVNGDGRINNRDLGMLQQLLNEWNPPAVEQACDVNGDGRINNRDLGALQQLLNT